MENLEKNLETRMHSHRHFKHWKLLDSLSVPFGALHLPLCHPFRLTLYYLKTGRYISPIPISMSPSYCTTRPDFIQPSQRYPFYDQPNLTVITYKLFRLLLLKCYNNKMVKSPGGPIYRGSFMWLTNKKIIMTPYLFIMV